MLSILGVAETTTTEGLHNFIEALSEKAPNKVTYGEKDETVMVEFDSEPGKIAYKVFKLLKLKERMVNTFAMKLRMKFDWFRRIPYIKNRCTHRTLCVLTLFSKQLKRKA